MVELFKQLEISIWETLICFFENNKANEKGGALFISTNHKIDINSCSFVSNTTMNGNGGAIFIRN